MLDGRRLVIGAGGPSPAYRRNMDSLWQTEHVTIQGDAFPYEEQVDIAVVGAGIAGLASALMFARAGQRVVVLEAREIGAGATGRTTAKVSQLQGTMLQTIRGRTLRPVVGAYVESQRAAFQWLLAFAEHSGVRIERRAALSYAATPDGRGAVEKEIRLAVEHGLPVELIEDAGLPFATFGAARLADQAQLDPLELLAALTRELRSLGGRVVTGARVTGVRASAPALVHTAAGELTARKVVLATGTPILDRGLYFAKLAARRSYAQAWEVPQDQLPDGMFLGVETPTRSVRTATRPDGRMLLLTGGNGHPVGRRASPQGAADELASWTRTWWADAEPIASWSAQDYLTPHGVPFVGWLPRGRGRIYLATGFSKWGMTNAVATALTLVEDILGTGSAPHWQTELHRRLTIPAAIAVGVGENAAVASWYLRGWARALAKPLTSFETEGTGQIGRRGVVPTASSTVDGTSASLCAICPHLGAIVTWNDFERSWDCPAHGSRFAPDGSVLEGPATRAMARR
jgi:glycine/D-amino acid oxidase-like deaminating enzyme/nitrite reductase/ring-hydroxylating ferredoxin subunit